jgi:hypothetical protein
MMRVPGRLLAIVAIVAIGVLGQPARALAQAAWEYTPYQVKLLIALEPAPQLPAGMVATIGDAVSKRAGAVWKGVLEIQVTDAPAKLRGAIWHELDHLTADDVAAGVERRDLEADKLLLALIGRREGGFVACVRELDCRSRQLGAVVERSCASVAGLPLALGDAVAEGFTPLARIEQVDERKIVARLRAGGLIGDAISPALVEPGMVLRPVIRRNDRTGQPAKGGGIQAIGWTFLSVDERRDSVLDCTLQSGFRSAIPARGGTRIERLALVARPRYEATRLLLRSRSDLSKPLAGYEIHRRTGESDSELLGVTGADGSFAVAVGDGSLETLIVKNGKQPLARLPLVPGYQETVAANIVDDDGRLAAEGFVDALNSRVLDLVARREILAAQIRARVKEGKGDDAQKLLNDFRRLESRADLNRDLDRFRQLVSTSDKATQARIDRVFADAQRLLLLKPLSDELLAQLTREVSAAKPSGGE